MARIALVLSAALALSSLPFVACVGDDPLRPKETDAGAVAEASTGADVGTAVDAGADGAAADADASGPTVTGTGNPKWAIRTGATYNEYVHAVAVDANGDVYATGGFNIGAVAPSTFAFGGACGSVTEFNAGFVARFSGATGQCVWVKVFQPTGSGAEARGLGIAVDSTNASAPVVYVAGYVGSGDNSDWRYGGARVNKPGTTNQQNVYATRNAMILQVAGADGAMQSAYADSPDNVPSEARGIAFDPVARKVVVCGKYGPAPSAYTLTYQSNASLTSVTAEAGFVVQLASPSYTVDWTVAAVGTPAETTACAFDTVHRPVVTGAFGAGGVTFNGTSALTSKGQVDGFVVKLAPTDGAVAWATPLGSAKDDAANAVHVDSNDDILVAGAFGAADSDFSSLSFAGGAADAYVAKLTVNGSVTFQRAYGSTDDDRGTGVRAGPQHEIVLTGFLGSAATIGGKGVGGAEPREPFALKTDPFGTLVWAKAYGTTTSPTPTADVSAGVAGAVAIAPNGDVVLGGAYVGNLLFDPTNLSNAGAYDGFVAKLAP
jgi:hypothetical protein